MNNKNFWIYGIVIFSILFLGGGVLFQIFEFGSLPMQFYGALIGVVITAIITVFLLQGQTATEEMKEQNMRIFEKKSAIFSALWITFGRFGRRKAYLWRRLWRLLGE